MRVNLPRFRPPRSVGADDLGGPRPPVSLSIHPAERNCEAQYHSLSLSQQLLYSTTIEAIIATQLSAMTA